MTDSERHWLAGTVLLVQGKLEKEMTGLDTSNLVVRGVKAGHLLLSSLLDLQLCMWLYESPGLPGCRVMCAVLPGRVSAGLWRLSVRQKCCMALRQCTGSDWCASS